MLKIDGVNTGFTNVDFSEKIKKSISELSKKYKQDKLGFVDLSEGKSLKEIQKFVEKNRYVFENVVVIGIGGSALGTKAVLSAIKGKYYNELSLKKRLDFPKLYVLDNVDPEEIKDLSEIISIKKTLFIVISKSGSTIETMSAYKFFKQKAIEKELDLRKHFVFIVGENSKFAEEKQKKAFKVFELQENVGGRFSVLSVVGLLPLALAGIDIDKLLVGAKNYKKAFFEDSLISNLALNSALLQYDAYKNNSKNITVFFPYSSNLKEFGSWYKQLFNESLGKNGLGPTLTVSVGSTDQHSDLQLYREGPNDKFVIFLEIESFSKNYKIDKESEMRFGDLLNIEKYGTAKSLTEKNIKNYTIKIDRLDEKTLGELIFFFEMQVAFLGELFEINAFDQPGVEFSKKITNEKIKELFGK
ncbi:glucose-6-phosphate isomerase [Candidatus Gracilibacteria bacterium]|nr:MAG: glucose-6-phosphate isomerase [Candidatus Gracilibacteria bacterium]